MCIYYELSQCQQRQMAVDLYDSHNLQLILVNAVILALLISFCVFILCRFAEIIQNGSGKKKKAAKNPGEVLSPRRRRRIPPEPPQN